MTHLGQSQGFSQAKLPLPTLLQKATRPRNPATSYLHAKGLHPGGHLSPNPAQAKNAQGLSIQLCSHELQPDRQKAKLAPRAELGH